MGNQEVEVAGQDPGAFQVRSRRDAIKPDALEVDPLVFQQHNALGQQAAGLQGSRVEKAVVVPGDEDAEPCRAGGVPGKEVLQVAGMESFAGVSRADEHVGIRGHGEPAVHPVGVRESEDQLIVVLEAHGWQGTHGSCQFSAFEQIISKLPSFGGFRDHLCSMTSKEDRQTPNSSAAEALPLDKRCICETIPKMRERRAFFAAIAGKYASMDAFVRDNGHWLDMVGIGLTGGENRLTLHLQLDGSEYETYFIESGRDGRLVVGNLVGFQDWTCANRLLDLDTGEYGNERQQNDK